MDDLLAGLDDLEEVEEEPQQLMLVDYELSENEARELTNTIRSAATVTFVLIAKAHEQKAWKALGYATWADYVQAEFDMSASRSYQLINLNRVVNAIEEATPDGTEIKITEAQARDIRQVLPGITEKIAQQTVDVSPEEASVQVQEIVEEERERLKTERELLKAEEKAKKEKQEALDEAHEQGRQEALEEIADQILADNPESEVEATVSDVPSGRGLVELANWQSFFNAVDSLSALPDPDKFVDQLSSSEMEQVKDKLDLVVSWIVRVQELIVKEF